MSASLLLVASQSCITVIAAVVAVIVTAIDVVTIICLQRQNVVLGTTWNTHTYILVQCSNTWNNVATLYVFINVLS